MLRRASAGLELDLLDAQCLAGQHGGHGSEVTGHRYDKLSGRESGVACTEDLLTWESGMKDLGHNNNEWSIAKAYRYK